MSTLLAALLPIRDRRDRTVGFELTSAPAMDEDAATAADANAREALALIPAFSRLAGRSLLVPVTPGIVHDGSLARFASTDAVMLVATDAVDDATTRRAIERLMSSGIRFALDGFPDGESLAPFFAGAIVALDARRTSSDILHSRIRSLLDAGLRPLVRGVDDRATRLQVLAHGAALHTGRLLPRAASVRTEDDISSSIVEAIQVLAVLSDGRPPDATFDRFIERDARISSALLKSVSSAAIGVRNPRSVSHAIALLGRDTVLENLAVATARLIGELAQDAELSMHAMLRVRLCEELGAALDPAPHQRARVAGALLSMLEFAFAEPAATLRQRLFGNLPQMLKDAMVERQQPLGQLIDLCEAMERGWWSDLRERCRVLDINTTVVATAYLQAWRSARDDLATRSEP